MWPHVLQKLLDRRNEERGRDLAEHIDEGAAEDRQRGSQEYLFDLTHPTGMTARCGVRLGGKLGACRHKRPAAADRGGGVRLLHPAVLPGESHLRSLRRGVAEVKLGVAPSTIERRAEICF